MSRKQILQWLLWGAAVMVAGLLDHFGRYSSYGFFLVGASAYLGYKTTERGWVLAALLSVSAPLAHLWMRLFTGFHAGFPWYYDAGVRLAGGVLLVSVGLGAGWLARLSWVAARRLRGRPALPI
jgi:hypothetical protein